jgi:hypothetical protein
MPELKTTEASIQATLKHALETCGYIVLEVAKGRSAKAGGLLRQARRREPLICS